MRCRVSPTIKSVLKTACGSLIQGLRTGPRVAQCSASTEASGECRLLEGHPQRAVAKRRVARVIREVGRVFTKITDDNVSIFSHSSTRVGADGPQAVRVAYTRCPTPAGLILGCFNPLVATFASARRHRDRRVVYTYVRPREFRHPASLWRCVLSLRSERNPLLLRTDGRVTSRYLRDCFPFLHSTRYRYSSINFSSSKISGIFVFEKYIQKVL